MSDNTQLPSAAGGDTIRTLDRTGLGLPKTEVVQLDAAGSSASKESLVSGNNPLPILGSTDQIRVALALQQAVALAAQPQNGFVPMELTGFYAALTNPLTAYYPQTAAEQAAGVTPINTQYPELNVLRYGALGDDFTDNVVAFTNAKSVASQYEFTAAPTVFFPAGIYRVATPTNWFLNNTGITLQTLGEVIIKSTGTSGHVMDFDAGVGLNGTHCFMLGDWTLDSTNQGVTVGLYTRNVSHSTFQVKVRNVVTSGVQIDGAVRNNYRVVCSTNEEAMTTLPTNGISINASAILSQTSDCYFDLTIEGLTGKTGITIGDAAFNIFVGTSEGNGTGILLPAYPHSFNNTFLNFDLEANTVIDIDNSGRGNAFINCIAGSVLNPGCIWRASASENLWIGGTLTGSAANPALTVTAGATYNSFIGFHANTFITDNGTGTVKWGIELFNSAQTAIQLPGLVTLNAPTGTSCLKMNSAANAYAMNVAGPNVGDQSFGLLISAGTTVNDACVTYRGPLGTVYSQLLGNGVMTLLKSPLASAQTQVVSGLAGFRASDNTAANNTLTADAQLTLTFNETGKYQFEIFLPFYQAVAGTAGFQFDLNSGTATVAAIVFNASGWSTAAVSFVGATTVSTATAMATIATAAASPSWILAKGWLSITVAGTRAVRWAQNTTDVNVTTLKTGAYFQAIKIG